jgi:ribosomal protein S18 acetylase RimI-like enzyme
MTTTITYHKGTVEDIPAFLSFFRTSVPILFPEYSPNSAAYEVDIDYGPKWMTDQLTLGLKIVYLAFDRSKVVGYLFTARSLAGVAFADWLGVDKDYQGRGIATKLLSLWQEVALEEGAHALQLWTSKKNIGFYEKQGFTNGGLFPKSWHGLDSYLMYKILREPEEKNFLKKYLSSLSS